MLLVPNPLKLLFSHGVIIILQSMFANTTNQDTNQLTFQLLVIFLTLTTLSKVKHLIKSQTSISNKVQSSQGLAHRVSMLTPSCFKTAFNSCNKYKSFSIIMDTGARICVTPARDNFIDYQEKVDVKEVKRLGGKVSPVAGQGHICRSVHDCTGKLCHFK